MWASLNEQTTRGLLTHLDGGCTAFMQKYVKKFIEKFGESRSYSFSLISIPENLDENAIIAEIQKSKLPIQGTTIIVVKQKDCYYVYGKDQKLVALDGRICSQIEFLNEKNQPLEHQVALSSQAATSKTSRKRVGLFSPEDPYVSRVQETLKYVLELSDCQLGEAYSEGDCFYDVCAQALNEIRKTTSHTFEQLRTSCSEYAHALEREYPAATTNPKEADKKANWIFQALSRDTHFYQQYLLQGRFTATEAEEYKARFSIGDGYAVWGEQAVDGRIICEQYKIRIHVIEIHEEAFDHSDIPILLHRIIDSGGSHPLESDSTELYTDASTIHIIAYRNHYVPLLRSPVPAAEVQSTTVTSAHKDAEFVVEYRTVTSLPSEVYNEITLKGGYAQLENVGRITAQLILPANPNDSLLKASKEALKHFQDSLELKEETKDRFTLSTDFCLDLISGEVFLYKENILGISTKCSRTSLNHPPDGQILNFFELANGEVSSKDLPNDIPPTPQQILCLSCMLGDANIAREILDANPTLIDKYDAETGCTPLHYAIYTIIGESKLDSFIDMTIADIIVSNKVNVEKTIKDRFGLINEEGWQIAIVKTLLDAGASISKKGAREQTFSPWLILNTAFDALQRKVIENRKSEILQQNFKLLEQIKHICEVPLQHVVYQP